MNTSFRRNDFWDLWFEDKRYLWLLEYRWPIRNYRLSTHKKKIPEITGTLSSQSFWRRELVLRKMNFFGLKLGKVFRKLATLISPPFSKSHHPGQPTVLKKIIPPSLVCERYSSHWHFLCMSILFNLFIHVNCRKLALNWLAWLCEICSSA